MYWKSEWKPYMNIFNPPDPNIMYVAVSEFGDIHGFGNSPNEACDMVRFRIKAMISRIIDGTLDKTPDLKVKAEWMAGYVDGEGGYVYMEATPSKRISAHEL